jgi:hypothetical protein
MDRREKKKPNSKASPVAYLEELKSTWLETMATDLKIQVTELDFLAMAHEEMVECWRVTRWAHAYGYFLPGPRERGRFEQLQLQASMSLDRLQVCTEKEKFELICARPARRSRRHLQRVQQGRGPNHGDAAVLWDARIPPDLCVQCIQFVSACVRCWNLGNGRSAGASLGWQQLARYRR